MQTSTLDKLKEFFLGKVCTVITVGVNKGAFPDQQFAEFFTGIVEAIDKDGVFTKHHLTGCKNFYAMEYVVGIIEEQVITDDNPKYQEIVEEVKKLPKESKPSVVDMNLNPQFVDPAMLAALQKQAQQGMGKMIQKN